MYTYMRNDYAFVSHCYSMDQTYVTQVHIMQGV